MKILSKNLAFNIFIFFIAYFMIRFQLNNFKGHLLKTLPSDTMIVDKNSLFSMYKNMNRIRQIENTCQRLYTNKEIQGFCHLSIGQEAIAAGIRESLDSKDGVITSYRSHGFTHLWGVSPEGVIGELLGKEEGCSKGKGGSMHTYAENFYGGNGIVGAQVPLGAGVALKYKYSKEKNVAVALYGDGAANQGQVFETYNMAALWKLPIIFVCENNNFAMGTETYRGSASMEYYKRGDFIPGLWVDGMDAKHVKQGFDFAKEYALENGPIVVEANTYRYVGHSVSDPGTTYRTKQEVKDVRRERDPIISLENDMIAENVATKEELKEISKKIKKEVEIATEKARNFSDAKSESAFDSIYSGKYMGTVRNVFGKGIQTRSFSTTRKNQEKITVRDAINKAIDDEMRDNESVFIMGEEVGNYQGAYKVTKGLIQKYGKDRVIDTPITEMGFAGIATGAAMAGLRPICEFMTFNFSMQAIDQVVNSAAKTYYMSGGTVNVPILFRGPNGAAAGVAAQHSQCFAAWYSSCPGLKVLSPYSSTDAYHMIRKGIQDNDPVICLENEILYNQEFDLDTEEEFNIGTAKIEKEGGDLTIVSYSFGVHKALEAAEILKDQGISAEVINIRSLRPLDKETIVKSVIKTGKLITVEEGWHQCGIGSEIFAQIVESDAFYHLDQPMSRLCGADIPMPYAKDMERVALPQTSDIVEQAQMYF